MKEPFFRRNNLKDMPSMLVNDSKGLISVIQAEHLLPLPSITTHRKKREIEHIQLSMKCRVKRQCSSVKILNAGGPQAHQRTMCRTCLPCPVDRS